MLSFDISWILSVLGTRCQGEFSVKYTRCSSTSTQILCLLQPSHEAVGCDFERDFVRALWFALFHQAILVLNRPHTCDKGIHSAAAYC